MLQNMEVRVGISNLYEDDKVVLLNWLSLTNMFVKFSRIYKTAYPFFREDEGLLNDDFLTFNVF